MELDLATVLSEEKASLAVECLHEEEKGQDKLGTMEVCYAWACEDLQNHKIAKSATDTLLDFVYFGVPASVPWRLCLWESCGGVREMDAC